VGTTRCSSAHLTDQLDATLAGIGLARALAAGEVDPDGEVAARGDRVHR
jgi:hypothetical protein